MGIDVYLEWEGKWRIPDNPDYSCPTFMERWAQEYNSPGVYIRESYFSHAYATHVFIPETFENVPFVDEPMVSPDSWPEGVVLVEGGIHYPWTVLAGRIEAVTQQAFLRYPDDDIAAKRHIDTFMSFVRKVRELEEAGVKSWVVNSY